MSRPEPAGILPRDPAPGAPVFAEPWHAEVLAVADALARAGVFTAAEWAEMLGAELRRSALAGLPDSDDLYYRGALAALERLVGSKLPSTAEALDGRIEAWRRAYLDTPHGRPVSLAAGAGGVADTYCPPEYAHRHHP